MMKFDSDFVMTVNGGPMAAEAMFDVVNPATGKVIAAAPDCTRAQLDQAVAAARAAFASWRSVSIEKRQELLRKAADILLANADELSRLFTREQGRPVGAAKFEIESAAGWLQAVSRMRPPVHVSEDSEAQLIETRYLPLGVVCAIAPWNVPVLLAIWKVARHCSLAIRWCSSHRRSPLFAR